MLQAHLPALINERYRLNLSAFISQRGIYVLSKQGVPLVTCSAPPRGLLNVNTRLWRECTYYNSPLPCPRPQMHMPNSLLHDSTRPLTLNANPLSWKSPTLHSRCRINKGLIKRGSTIDHSWSRGKGWFYGPPLIHTYIHTLSWRTRSPSWTETLVECQYFGVWQVWQ
jgi:hypothetical protein